jgi:hypothetical protein
VGPGDTLVVELVADPVRPFREQRSRFSVHSRTAALEDAPAVVDEQELLIPGVPVLRRAVPFILLALGAAAIPLVVLSLVQTIP